ncbi:MAG: hypothetical protein ACP5R6_02930 [Chlorobaculum sp.]
MVFGQEIQANCGQVKQKNIEKGTGLRENPKGSFDVNLCKKESYKSVTGWAKQCFSLMAIGSERLVIYSP